MKLLRKVFTIAALGATSLLLACGSDKIHEPYTPDSIITLGDAFVNYAGDGTVCQGDAAAIGHSGRSTINQGCEKDGDNYKHKFGNSIVTTIADYAGIAYDKKPELIKNYAQNNALINTGFYQDTNIDAYFEPVKSLKEQIDQLEKDNISFTDNTLVLVSAGTADIIAQVRLVEDKTITGSDAHYNATRLANEYLAQIKRLTSKAKHIVLISPYNLQKSIWGRATPERSGLLETLTTKDSKDNNKNSFNQILKVDRSDYLSANTMLFSLADLTSGRLPSKSNIEDSETEDNPFAKYYSQAICNSTTSGKGIGIGTGKVDSAQCNPETLIEGKAITVLDNNEYFFADEIYPTPRIYTWFGYRIYDTLRYKKWIN